jgi:transcriptional regulator of heat shock response
MMNKRIRELAEQAESKSEMLRLLAKRHNMRVVDITIDEEE